MNYLNKKILFSFFLFLIFCVSISNVSAKGASTEPLSAEEDPTLIELWGIE